MRLKKSVIFSLLLSMIIMMGSIPAFATERPKITSQTGQYIDRGISINIQWQSVNPVTKVRVYAGSGEKETKIDEYDNRRNPYGYEGEVNVVVQVDPSLYQGLLSYQIQLEDDLRLKSDLFTGKIKLPAVAAAGMPGMMPGMVPGAMPGQQGQPGDDRGWGKSHIQAGMGTSKTPDGQSSDMVDKLLKVADRFDTPPSLDTIKVNVLGPDNVSFTSKANDDKGLGEIAFRVYDTQGNKIGEQILTGLGKKWEGSTQPIKTGGGSFIVVAQAKDSTGNTSKEQRASFTMSGAPLPPQAPADQPPVQQTPVEQPPVTPPVENPPPVTPPATNSDLQNLPSIAEPVIFNNGNIAGVQNGPTRGTSFSINAPHRVTFIYNYHYFNNGKLPGTISLRHSDGTIYGPWQTEGALGQGGVKNAYWFVRPNIEIKAGSYTVIDSDPATWSHNSGSSGAGFTEIRGAASM